MNNGCDAPGLMPIETALEQMRDTLVPISEQQFVPLKSSLGMVLASTVFSPFDVPLFDNSAMDGYAVRVGDLEQSKTLTLVGKSYAGQPFTGECAPGQCVRIMTGAALPERLDTVVMQEKVDVEGDKITFPDGIRLADNIRQQGEELTKGDLVLSGGSIITPREVGMLASLGIAQVEVKKALRVAIFSTGDELKQPGCELGPGEIYDSNRFAIRALLQQMPVELIDLGVIPDDENAIADAFIQADHQADVVITSGGVSVGEADYTKEIMEQMGQINFWKLAIKPGKPFAFGKLPNSDFFGLPGNPVSAFVTFYQLVQPMLYHLQGASFSMPPELPATTTSELRKKPGRADFQRGIAKMDADGKLHVQATGNQGSAIFTSMVDANCFIILERERGRVSVGEKVQIQMFNRLLT